MTPHALKIKTESLIKQRNVMAALLFGSVFATIAVSAVALSKKNQIILVPSTVEEYAIIKGRVPDNYLISMTRDVATLLLNRHPHDTDYFKTNILRLVEPRYHDAIEKQISVDEVENKYKTGERVFRPSSMCVLRGKGLVSEVIGRMDTYVNDRRVSTEKRVQQFRWRLVGTRLWLSDTKEIEYSESECVKMNIEKKKR